jgi:hypothetical protein
MTGPVVTPDAQVAAGGKGFKAELDGLRERMRGLGFSYDEIAAEIGRVWGSVADRTRPGELLRLVADGLAGSGLDVRLSEHAEGSRLVIVYGAGECVVSVSDWGCAEWEYCPGRDADPGLAADLATALLTGRAGRCPRLASGDERGGITFKGIAGRELKARGLEVELAVYADEDYFDAAAEIVVTSPGSGDDAKVYITDDGWLTWMRDYWPESAVVVPGPESCGQLADPVGVAASVAETITRAMSCLRPAGQEGPA